MVVTDVVLGAVVVTDAVLGAVVVTDVVLGADSLDYDDLPDIMTGL